MGRPHPWILLTFAALCPAQPATLWNATASGPDVRFIELRLRDPFSIPGASHATVQLLDAARRPLKSWTFEAGWRNRLGLPTVEYSPEFKADLLILRSEPVINGRDIAKLFFTIRDEQLRFIRIEDRAGAPVRNRFGIDTFDLGVPPPAKTPAEFAALLDSPHPDDVLAALLYLGGENGLPESAGRFAIAVQQVAFAPEIQRRVAALALSPHRWIRQAAFASQP